MIKYSLVLALLFLGCEAPESYLTELYLHGAQDKLSRFYVTNDAGQLQYDILLRPQQDSTVYLSGFCFQMSVIIYEGRETVWQTVVVKAENITTDWKQVRVVGHSGQRMAGDYVETFEICQD